MKIGDLVKWVQPGATEPSPIHTGIIVDGPRDGSVADYRAISYAVAWFIAQETMWHNDYNLELISASEVKTFI